jgi:replicative DNA helicase
MSAVLMMPGDDFPPPDRAIAQLRIPPHSIESESSLLGGLLLDNRAWDRVGDLLTDSDFYRYEHRIIFEVAAALINANKPADIFTVFDQVQRIGKSAEVTLAYLQSLAQYVPSAANIRRYAEIVRERAILRSLIAMSDEIATSAFNPHDRSVDQILDEAETKVFGIANKRKGSGDDWQQPEDAMVEFLDAIQKRHDGDQDFVATGIRALDDKLDGGMRPGDLIIIAARPSVGKTALALSIGENVAQGESPVGVFSLEMTLPQLSRRRVAMHSHVPLHKIKRPERMSEGDWDSMTRSVDSIRALPLYCAAMSSPNINQVRTRARNLKRRHGLRVLIVDYIGLMEGTDRRADRRIQLGEVSRGMKALAKELGISILLLAQLNRDVEKRPNMKPQLSDLRECGDIEQDADAILFVHRPFHVKPELGEEWRYYGEIIIGKQRDGETGSVPVMYVGEAVTFKDWPVSMEIPKSQVVTQKSAARGMEP